MVACLLLGLLARIACGWIPFARVDTAVVGASLSATWVLLDGWKRCPLAPAPAALRAILAAAACAAIGLAGHA
ncbi:MAG: hypothetical protein ACXWC6_00110 [Ramlibacter sp.]